MCRPLDIEQPDMLVAYLRDRHLIGEGEVVQIAPLAGGVSNRTVLVKRPSGETWVLKQALERLRVQTEWHSDPRRIHREAAALRRLPELCPPGSIPWFVFEDASEHVLAMTAVPEPHDNWKHLLLAGQVDPDHVSQFARLLADIHVGGSKARRLLSAEFADRSFFESLRIEPYYAFTATQVPAAAEFLRALIDDCRLRIWTLVHGDFSPKNILVHQGTLVLLDHEVIHFGDGAFDAGFALTHLLSKAHHLPAYRDAFEEAARLFWTMYYARVAAFAGDVHEILTVRHTLGCLLARVAGRSPLEYLRADERDRQRRVVVDLIHALPVNVPELIDEFVARV